MNTVSLDLKSLQAALEAHCENLTVVEEIPLHQLYTGDSKKTKSKVSVLVYSDSEENLKKIQGTYDKVTKVKHELVPTVEDYVLFKSESQKSHLAIITADELGETFFD